MKAMEYNHRCQCHMSVKHGHVSCTRTHFQPELSVLHMLILTSESELPNHLMNIGDYKTYKLYANYLITATHASNKKFFMETNWKWIYCS